MQVGLELIPLHVAGVVDRLVEDEKHSAQEAVLLHPAMGKVQVLNEVGTRIWALTDGRRSVKQIIEILCQEYEVSPQQVEEDVLEFIGDLAQRELLTLHSAPVSGDK